MLFRDPDLDDDISLARALELTPSDAATRGFYFQELVRAASQGGQPPEDLFEGLSHRSFVPIFNYPLRDYMTLLVRAARHLAPSGTLRHRVRLLGQRMYMAFEETSVGATTTRAANATIDAVLRISPTIIKLSVTPGAVRAERIGDRHWRGHYSDIYCFLGSFHVGVVEGVVKRFGATPIVQVALTSPISGVLDIRWR